MQSPDAVAMQTSVVDAKLQSPVLHGNKLGCKRRLEDVPQLSGATPNPGKLSLGFLDGSKWKGGYKMEDIYYFELCVLNELCENGDEMFSCMGSREHEFRCKTNPRRLAAFRDLMLSMDHG